MDRNTLREKLSAYCEENRIFGVLRVTHRDRIVWQQSFGYADIQTKEPFDSTSMFTFYSLSKPFCAIGLLRLKDRGLVDLDTHPGVYVPEAAAFDSRVTIRHMLHHLSGLPDFGLIADFAAVHGGYDHRRVREKLAALSAYPQLFAPGEAARYANINLLLCALIIEAVTGRPYADYMQDEVFAPLGMKTALVDHAGRQVEHRVSGHELTDGVPVPVSAAYDWMLGAGDIIGTVEDVYCLNRAIKHRLLLAPATWAEALTPSPLNQMGMGCTVTAWHGKRRITHNGGHKGFRTLHIQLPEEDFDIILLSNSGYGDARAALSEMVYEAFFGADGAYSDTVAMDTGYIPQV